MWVGSDNEEQTFLWNRDIHYTLWKVVQDRVPTMWVRSCRPEVEVGQVLEQVVDILERFHGVAGLQAALGKRDLGITYKGEAQSGVEKLIGYPQKTMFLISLTESLPEELKNHSGLVWECQKCHRA